MYIGSDRGGSVSLRAANQRVVIEVAQLIAWIGSALTISPFEEHLAYVKPILTGLPQPASFTYSHDRGSPNVSFNITFDLKKLHETEVNTCWLSLFAGVAIANGFPIPDRPDEVGLEVPLELLAGIAGIRHAMEYEGGVVLKGFFHMFVPIQKSDDRVQWYAITSEDSETRLTYNEGLSRCKSRALSDEVGLDDLQSTRAIVGWCSIAISRLGSQAANCENVDYSDAKAASSVLSCAGGEIGFQQFATGTLNFKFGTRYNSVHIARTGRYQRIVSAAEKTPVVLFDTQARRGWLVFASDVILHMMQTRHRLEPFERNGTPVHLNTAVPVESSAKRILLDNEKFPVSDDANYMFKDVVLEIWSTMESLIDQNVARNQNTQGTPMKATLRQFVQGYEFKAVVEERSPFTLKEQALSKTHGGWLLLIQDINALVLVADGFGEVILPAEAARSKLCRLWHSLPSSLDYLATTSKILNDLYNVADCRVNRKYLTSSQLQWHRGQSLVFEAFENTTACRCNRLQQFIPSASIGTVISPGIIIDEGAIIFGHSGSLLQDLFSKPRQDITEASGIYCQPNLPLAHAGIQSYCEDTASSDISGQSRSDGTADSIPASLSTCTTLSAHDTLPEIFEVEMNIKPIACSKKRTGLGDSQVRLSDRDRESYKSFESKQPLLRAEKRHRMLSRDDPGMQSDSG